MRPGRTDEQNARHERARGSELQSFEESMKIASVTIHVIMCLYKFTPLVAHFLCALWIAREEGQCISQSLWIIWRNKQSTPRLFHIELTRQCSGSSHDNRLP